MSVTTVHPAPVAPSRRSQGPETWFIISGWTDSTTSGSAARQGARRSNRSEAGRAGWPARGERGAPCWIPWKDRPPGRRRPLDDRGVEGSRSAGSSPVPVRSAYPHHVSSGRGSRLRARGSSALAARGDRLPLSEQDQDRTRCGGDDGSVLGLASPGPSAPPARAACRRGGRIQRICSGQYQVINRHQHDPRWSPKKRCCAPA